MDGTTYAALGQPGVGFFMAIIVGALAGWLAEKLTRSDMGLLANNVMGIIRRRRRQFPAAPPRRRPGLGFPGQPDHRHCRRRHRDHDLPGGRGPPKDVLAQVSRAAAARAAVCAEARHALSHPCRG
jgi:hypothetical protein